MRLVIIAILTIFTFSCSSQRGKSKSKTKNHISESETCNDFYKTYKNIDNGAFFTEELSKFSEMENGILFYSYQDGLEHGKLTIVGFQNGRIDSYSRNNFQKRNLVLTDKVKDSIKKKIGAFEKQKCYAETSKIISTNNFYLMLVVKNKVVITQHSIHGNISFERTTDNPDLNKSLNLLETMYSISFISSN